MNLRLKDVDLDVLEVTIPSGKGDRERVTVLPGAGHFCHGQLSLLKSMVLGAWHD